MVKSFINSEDLLTPGSAVHQLCVLAPTIKPPGLRVPICETECELSSPYRVDVRTTSTG